MPPDVLALADAVLSTSGMIKYARGTANEFLWYQCGLSDRLLLELPEEVLQELQAVRGMKMITLDDTAASLGDASRSS